MDWRKGFSAMYYASFVDVNTWKSVERFEITGGSIKATGTGLRESADLDCMNFTYGERWVRIYLVANQMDSSETVPLFTGLSCCPDDDIDGYHVKNNVELYSVLKPCEDVLLPRGYYVPVGMNGGRAIKKLLSATPAPVVIDGNAPELSSNIVAEDGETHLSMADKILNAINWRYRIEGDGTIHVTPYSSEPVASFDPIKNDCLETEIKKTYDWYQCPNVFRAVDDEVSAVARDDSPKSPYSTVNRGREIWMEETSCTLNANESISQYAWRRLKEEQNVSMTASYDRRFNPNVKVTDVISLNYPAQGLTGNFVVKSLSIELGHGARTSEEVIKV